MTEQHRDDPREIVPLLPARRSTAEEQVVDVIWGERRHLPERSRDHLRGQVVGRTAASEPLRARPIGARAAATLAASGIVYLCQGGRARVTGGRDPARPGREEPDLQAVSDRG